MVNATDYTARQSNLSDFAPRLTTPAAPQRQSPLKPIRDFLRAPLQPLKTHIDNIEVKDTELAHFLCSLIPAQCPFERDIRAFGKVLFHIPPLCKLNPFYEQLVFLRFRALCYLADECGEDISAYC